MPTRRVAVYTGMFDPVHLGHLDIVERGRRLFDRLVIGVGINPEKLPLFTVEERVRLLEQCTKSFANVEVKPFTDLSVRFVRQVGAGIMLRGLRTVTDMEFEFSMSLTNQSLDAEIETVFLMSRIEYTHLSSSLIRQVASFGGDLRKFLPPTIVHAVETKARERRQGPV
jgi:pantetheine-phosphate adenylyltransferase